MAHSAMHFGIGLTSGALAGLPLVFKAVRRRMPPAGAAAKWLIASYAAAVIAVIPSILDNLGVPANITSSWPMNIFLLHPVINLKKGGKLIGEVLIVACFFFQYLILMILLWRSRKTASRNNDE